MSVSTSSPPLVSVITPAYNVAAFIGASIESALKQTCQAVEVIVVDDGSTDATAEVVVGYANRDARVRLIRTPNRGVSAARNTAMGAARGRYFAFLDGDDDWLPGFLEEQLTVFRESPAVGVVSGNAWNRGGPLDGRVVRAWPPERRELTVRDIVEHEDAVFIMSVFRRELFEAIGGIDPSLRRSEDYDFWLRAIVAGFRIVANPPPLGYYRRRADSASADELAMIDAIRHVLTRLRTTRLDGETQESVDSALASLDYRYLTARAKTSLLAGQYESAARDFRELRRLSRTSTRAGALALLSSAVPGLLRLAYKVRSR